MNVHFAERLMVTNPPVRTCVGCRARAHQGDLLRVVLVAARLVPDPRRVLSGRGAYVHLNKECVSTALARKAFGRALRVGGPTDPQDLTEALRTLTESIVGSVGMTTR